MSVIFSIKNSKIPANGLVKIAITILKDQLVLTIYRYAMNIEQQLMIKKIQKYTSVHLSF